MPPEGAVIPERHPKAPASGTKIPSHFGHCFGCGELHPTGLHLVAHVGDGKRAEALAHLDAFGAHDQGEMGENGKRRF